MDVRDLVVRLEAVLRLAESGCEVIVTDVSGNRATLTPWKRTEPRVMGLHRGAFVMAPDFDEPLPNSFWNREPGIHYSKPMRSSGWTAIPSNFPNRLWRR